jgi:S-adenosylmethionine decarboxylase
MGDEPQTAVMVVQRASPLEYQDLAPQILRQRLVVEGYPSTPISDENIKDYLCRLSDLIGMITLIDPVTHRSDLYGWAGWIHWETSGAHFYAWEQPLLFFSVDIYSCKAFEVAAALEFTRRYFDAVKLTAKSF